MSNPNNRAGWNWLGFKIGDVVSFDAALGPAQVIDLLDPSVGEGTGLVYDILLRYVDPALRHEHPKYFAYASSECWLVNE